MGELASDGRMIYPNRAAQAFGYDGNGKMITATLTQYSAVYVKTYTWTNALLTAQSLWVKQ